MLSNETFHREKPPRQKQMQRESSTAPPQFNCLAPASCRFVWTQGGPCAGIILDRSLFVVRRFLVEAKSSGRPGASAPGIDRVLRLSRSMSCMCYYYSINAFRFRLLFRLWLGPIERSFVLSLTTSRDDLPIRLVVRAYSSSRTPAPSTYDCRRRLLSLLSYFEPMLSSMLPCPSLLCRKLMVRPSELPFRSTLTPCDALKRIVNPSSSSCDLVSLLPLRPVALRGFTSLPSRLALPSPLALLPVSLLLVCVLRRTSLSESAVSGIDVGSTGVDFCAW